MISQKPKAHRGAGRVAYLAVRHQVEESLEAGHDVVAIYERFSARLPVGYKQFAKYVQRFSDDHKVRPQGWMPRIKLARPGKAYATVDSVPKPSLPTLSSASERQMVEPLPVCRRDEDLF